MKAKIIVILTFGLLFIVAPDYSRADIFDLSYTLTEGGFKLELSPLNLRRGVRLRINSDINTRYEVMQRIIKPLQSVDNPAVTIRDNFVFQGLRGTNRFGTLRLPINETPVRSQEILYTSDTQGSPDTFTIIYGLTNHQDLPAGEYLGRISFILNPINASRAQVTKILDVRVSISQDRTKGPAIEITTASGSKLVSLNPKRKDSSEVLIKIDPRLKQNFSITQLLSNHLESAQGDRIDLEAVQFSVKEVKSGSLVKPFSPLSLRPQKLFSFADPGANQLIVTYRVNNLSGEKFGKYASQINYLLEDKGVQTKIDSLRIEVENERIFDLVATPQGKKYNLEFRNLKPHQTPKKDEVIIQINTNLGKPYQVTQNINSDLVNKEGESIPSEYFTFYTENIETKGKIQYSSKTNVKKGETILFVSDEYGSADKFKVIYELGCPEKSEPGDYSTQVTYSLLEM